MKKKTIGCVLAVRKNNHNNYGTSLQAYATVKILQSIDLNVEIIRYNKNRSLLKTLLALPNYLRSGGKSELLIRINKKVNGLFLKNFKTNNHIRNIAVENFKETFFEPLCRYFNGYEELKNGAKNYDICMVGSDQLWHPMGFASNFYNLLFVDDNIPKIAYAASFGISQIPIFQKEGTKKYLERYDWISVREQAGKNIVENISSKKADLVCDPTMLITKEEWVTFASSSKYNISEPYIFCYFLGEREDIRKQAQLLSDKTGYKILIMRHVDKFQKSDETIGDIVPYDISPIDFVHLLYKAEIVLTDSFHGTIFSIIMEKKFLTFYRVKPQIPLLHSRIDAYLTFSSKQTL